MSSSDGTGGDPDLQPSATTTASTATGTAPTDLFQQLLHMGPSATPSVPPPSVSSMEGVHPMMVQMMQMQQSMQQQMFLLQQQWMAQASVPNTVSVWNFVPSFISNI